MLSRDGAERELENSCAALRVFAEAGIPIVRQRFAGDTFDHKLLRYESLHCGGCLNPDHLQQIAGDNGSAYQALAYSIGYLKALFAALAA